MIGLIIALAVLLGAGGTAVVADTARPGDFLFPVDQTVESIQFAFTPEKNKVDLKIKFVNERLDELESILDDENATSTATGVSEEAKLNLTQALDILTRHLAEIHGLASTTPGIAQAISIIEARLSSAAGALPAELRVKIRDDSGRIELKTEDGKLKIKVRNGEIEVESEFEDEDSDNERRGSNSGSNATSTKSDDEDEDSA